MIVECHVELSREEPADLAVKVLADTACAKTVAGEGWVDESTASSAKPNLPWCAVPEEGSVRFGPGPRVWSEEALIFYA